MLMLKWYRCNEKGILAELNSTEKRSLDEIRGVELSELNFGANRTRRALIFLEVRMHEMRTKVVPRTVASLEMGCFFYARRKIYV